MSWSIGYYSGALQRELLGLPATVQARYIHLAARIFYCTLPGRRIVMLHQFVKKSEKTPTREIRLARRRMTEIKDAHA